MTIKQERKKVARSVVRVIRSQLEWDKQDSALSENKHQALEERWGLVKSGVENLLPSRNYLLSDLAETNLQATHFRELFDLSASFFFISNFGRVILALGISSFPGVAVDGIFMTKLS
ncbi:hypothetical protein QQP08_025340 [Theobroma cacao]|nr:hypothetical protein QQP08_025340 [Theobroma cacao]